MNFLRDVCSLHRNLSTTFHGVLLAIILKESVYFFVYLLDMTDSTVLYIYIRASWEESRSHELQAFAHFFRKRPQRHFVVASNCHWKKISRQTRGLLHRTTGLGNKQTNSACGSIAKDWREFELCGYLPIWESLPPSEYVLCWTQITSTGQLGEETERIFQSKWWCFLYFFVVLPTPLENDPKFVVTEMR